MKLQHKHARYIQGESLIQFHTYPNGRQAIQLVDPEDGCPNCVASVNLPDEPCPEGHCYLKTYSENEGIAEDLIESGIVSKPVAFSVQLGAPLVRILDAPHGYSCDCDACEADAIVDQMNRMMGG